MRCQHIYIFITCLLLSSGLRAQEKPIGYWTSLLPYNSSYGIATDGYTIFNISQQAFFTLDPKTYETTTYSKVNGMSDIGMKCIAYDKQTNTVILAYTNSNIDLFKDNSFVNIPDIKLKTVAGDKKINNIYTKNGRAYLSTSLGVVVLDLEKQSVEETYQFFVNSQLVSITAFTAYNGYFYAATPSGMYRANENSPQLQNFQVWEKIDSTHVFKDIQVINNKLIMSTPLVIYQLQSDTAAKVFASDTTGITGVDGGYGKYFIRRFADIRVLDTNFIQVDSITFIDSFSKVIQLADSSVWIGGLYHGLAWRPRAGLYYPIYPDGPSDPNSYDIYAHNSDVWVAHGGYNDLFLVNNNLNGFSNYKSGKWKLFSSNTYAPISYKMADFVTITKDESTGTVYAGSFSGGLFELKSNDSFTIYKNGSALEVSQPNGGSNFYQVVGTAMDKDNNLWVSMYGSFHELYVREKATSNWYKYYLNYTRNYPYSGGPMVFDNSGHVWYVCTNGGGVIGYDTKGTFSDPGDDVSFHMTSGAGSGNLPDGNVKSIAIDKNDNLWIGTVNGIGILYNASSCLGQRCDAEIPIVQYDKYAGYLFAGETVQTIAVDGANRKWVGTNNGVWLLSPDAGNSSIIYRFTTDNSPLPSNKIQKITIDDVTGDVYIGTDQGLMCYRSTATEGAETAANVLTFPNPVPSNYKGTIAIKGLTANADVRITDINGQLVYRTTALGGQAVWNGLDYKGHRPQSGVYLIFASNTDGSQTYAGKMVFMN